MRTLDIDSLATFLACVSAPSFADAGARVHKSQSTVSMQMRKLEDTVGQALFVKRGRRNHLTSAGQELAEYAERIVRMNEEALGRLDPRRLEGRLRIGTPDDYAEMFLPTVFGRFARRHPTVEIAIDCRQSDELMRCVEEGTLDLAIVTMGPTIKGATAIRREGLSWVAPMDRRLELERPLPVAVWQPGCVWRECTLAALDAAGIEYRIAYSGWNGVALMSTVRAGLAVSALPARFLGRDLRVSESDHGLPPLGTFEVGIVLSPRGPKALVETFRDEIVGAFEDVEESFGAAAA